MMVSDKRKGCLLSQLSLNQPGVIMDIEAPQFAPEWADWLADIGFIPGETVCLLNRHVPGGDPLVVRIGDSTFALRKAEAACVKVELVQGAVE